MDWKDIITFWFEELKEEQWFKKDETLDATIRERFTDIHAKICKEGAPEWHDAPEGRLAEIIVLDQFSRNMFRDTPQAFAGDLLALSLAREAVALNIDKEIPEKKRAFMYMPYMHSESKDIHEEAVPLFESLGDEGYLKYEHLHKDIIDRFGRYPHRNDILGRESKPEEAEFLKTNKGF